jgi:nitrite reductase (NADH) large subunit
MKNYLIIGNGVAGTTAAENIREKDPDGRITIVTDEDFPYYYRIRLNEFICGEISEEGLLAKKTTWYEENRIELRAGLLVTGGDPAKREVATADGGTLSYDALLLATGSHSFIPPIPGADTEGVFTLRTIEDARKIIKYAQKSKTVVLIGGGLLGLEAGNALRKIGKKVTVVEFCPHLLPRQLDKRGAERLTKMMEGMGFSFRVGAATQEIVGSDSVKSVLLKGGESLPADMVLLSAGVRSNIELANMLKLKTEKGIVVDSKMRTSQPEIFAAGDVAEFDKTLYGIWPAALEQGKVAGSVMAGGSEIYAGTTMANKLKVAGIDLGSAGEIDSEGKYDSQVEEKGDVYKKFVIDNNHLIGVIMLGDTKGFASMIKAIHEQTPIDQLQLV